eukprot:327614-Alexandrium_andersonii.AAC.1
MEEIMDLHKDDLKWPVDVSRDFAANVSKYLTLLTAIASHYHSQGLYLFNVTMKAHYLLHLA